LLSKEAIGIRGIVFGRFQQKSNMTPELFAQMIASKRELQGLPIVAGVDFGHTSPIITFPIGGQVKLKAGQGAIEVVIA